MSFSLPQPSALTPQPSLRMRLRTLAALALATLALAPRQSRAQSNPNAAGLERGDYVRLSGGIVTPVNAGGSLRSWKQGTALNVMWENWDLGGGGNLGLLGFGFYGDLGLLPFDADQFIADFSTGPNGRVLTATAGHARIFQFGVNTRIRIPMPYVMPSVSLGFGFLDWRPAQITYTADRTGAVKQTAKQQNRQGGVVTLIGGLDRQIYGRVGIFGEALYSYGFTSFGQGLAASGSQCIVSNCDLLKNTTLGTLRGGIRVRTTR